MSWITGKSRPDTGKLHAQIALRRVPASGLHVFLASAPHQAEHLVKWKAVLLEFFNGHGWRIAKEVPHDPIGPHAARDIEHLGGHLDAGRWHGKVAALIAFHLADAIEDGQGLTSCRVIVEEIGDLGALLRAPFVLEILHRRTHLRPVGSGHREDIGIALTIRGIGPPEAWGQPWDFVLHMTWRQGIDNRCAVIQHRYSPLAFQAFVCFHASVDLVAMSPLRYKRSVWPLTPPCLFTSLT